jgi:sugar/nucleoside kinase (ribokinase family)
VRAPLTVHETILGVLVCALGDVLLDVIVRLHRPLERGDDVRAAAITRAGGQAANVAAWAAELGAEARVVCVRANDDTGRLVAAELDRRRIQVAGPVVKGRTGVVVSIVEPDGERSLASDRGVSAELLADGVEDAWLECDALHVSGYALAAARRAPGVRRLSVDLASWTAIEEAGPESVRERLFALEPDVVFAGLREFEALGGSVPAGEVIRKWELPRADVAVVDSTGAGDAFAAGFLVGGLELGLEAAARCVQTIGGLP